MDTKKLKEEGYIWEWDGNPEGPHALLTSGNHSGIFINATAICCDPSLIHEYCLEEVLKKCFSNEYFMDEIFEAPLILDQDLIVLCPGYGAMGLADELAFRFWTTWGFTDKENGKHVLKRFDVKNKMVFVCEDVLTTGGSLKELINLVRENGGTVWEKGLVLFNRTGINPFPIDGVDIYGIFNIPPNIYSPEKCPYCKEGSVALKPKANWDLFMEYNKIEEE